ncbi:hypothetical protein [Thermofilum sp.]|uniref:hypothetical protein n=1 Tax=Thermofilum sp. TaxID=1961369 RepID=UPI003169CEC8
MSILILMLLAIILLDGFTTWAQVQPLTVLELEDKATYNIAENGDAYVEEVISMSATAFASFKQQYPMLSMLTRLFKSKRTDVEITNLNIQVDEANNRIIAKYVIKGAAVYKKDYWEMKIASEKQKVTLSAQTGNTLVFTYAGAVTTDTRMIITSTINLPKEAKNIKFISDTNTLRYEYTPPTASGLSMAGNPIFLVLGLVLAIFAIANMVLPMRKTAPTAPPPPPPPANL